MSVPGLYRRYGVGKIFVDHAGEADEITSREQRRHVRFPVCLSVRYKGGVSESCADFVLNIGKGGVFIATDAPAEVGAEVVMRFYIPPGEKLLGEFAGRVVGVNRDRPEYPRGMHIKFVDCPKESLEELEALLEERRNLVDELA